ncbi:glucokinase [Elizabethkingia anophelis]|nr:glucokinase [Elizabethkingia anophelis]MDV2466458.1 glucokinase [Elizabethkingia anophelis]MDV3529256.1 glucokinase [Elizabethkingia anophelis]MDV3822980.1 glucokinase [Elizabethkingia anophelis]MDV3849516.1 glucokinase [Elizabethkingia anophelis]
MELMRFPLHLPGWKNADNDGLSVIATDIGGTKTNLGWFVSENHKMVLKEEATYPSRDYSSFSDIIKDFIKNYKLELPDVLSIGVAGPVVDGKCITTNLPWSLDVSLLKNELRINRVEMINDLEATAYGLAEVNDGYLATIHKGNPNIHGNVAILAPGTGLGEAGLFWDGKALRPFATEGGHSEFSPRNKTEVEFYEYLNSIYGIVSWETVISGPGIFNIYRFLRDVKKHPEPAWLTQKFEEEGDPSAIISHTAMRELDPTCSLAMEMFVDFMAREATNLVLKLKATGGLLLGGGIPPKIFNLLNKDKFHQNFIVSDKMEHILKDIPIYLILNSKTALMGAAYYGAYGRV